MAMSKCKECGKAVSTLAKTCPNCGVPKPAFKKKKTKKIKLSKPKKKINEEQRFKKAIDAAVDSSKEQQRIQQQTASKKLVWAHCSNRKCKEYTQMYQFKKSELADVYETCNVCKNNFKEANVENGRPIMPTDGTYKSPTVSYKSNTDSNSTQTTSGEKGTWETFLDGNLDLATSFWGFLIVGTFVVGFVCGWLSAAYGMGWFIPLAIYTFFAVGGTWASAENYKKKQLSKQQSVLWGILAQIVCVLNVISVISMLVDMF